MTENVKKPEIINTTKWITENEDKFKPPVCNKLMHNNQLIIMFVGGPNIREDYHIQEGEELFYQVKGDMVLKIIENNQHKDVSIKQGEFFLLPARVPHSPQRLADTVGLVIERRRDQSELDCVRWFVSNNSSDVLYEKWFYCTDLGVQLAPVIKEFFASEEYKTRVPGNNVVDKNLAPFKLNNVLLQSDKNGPYDLVEKLSTLNGNSKLLSYEELKMQFHVEVLVPGETHLISDFNEKSVDLWLWQLQGTSKVRLSGDNSFEYDLIPNDSLLVTENYCKIVEIEVQEGFMLAVRQDPRLK